MSRVYFARPDPEVRRSWIVVYDRDDGKPIQVVAGMVFQDEHKAELVAQALNEAYRADR